jgi:hypothetical protein
MNFLKARTLRHALALALAFAVLTLAAVGVSGSTSTNFELRRQTTPAGAGDAFSTNYHLVAVLPQDPSGVLRVSTNYELETIFVPQTFEPVDTTPPVIIAGPTVLYVSDSSALIEWTTDELADGVVEYGLTTAYGSSETQAGGFSTLHQVLVTGLTASTTYEFRVNSTDVYSNGPTQDTGQFTTAGVPDTTGPVINQTVTVTSTQSATIDFTTSEAATSVVDHGPTVTLGTSLPDAVFRTTHTRAISGLTPGTTLFYEITATDPESNPSTTGVLSVAIPEDVQITTTTLPGGQTGSVYSEFVVATGGVGALTWTLETGALPPGIALIPGTGELSGIPSASGTFDFAVRVTDSGSPASFDIGSLQIIVSGSSGGGGKKDDGGCSSGEGTGGLAWLALLGALAAFGARGLRRV